MSIFHHYSISIEIDGIAWSNISKHALNSVFALFEIIFTNVPPMPWVDLPATIIILAAYLGVAYITHATQGFYSTFNRYLILQLLNMLRSLSILLPQP